MEIKRTFDILDRLRSITQKHDILNAKVNKKWVNYSIADLIDNSNYVSAALLKMGLSPGDKAVILAANMPQWNFVDYGCQQAAIISVPLFPTIGTSDLKYILQHCEARIVFISEKAAYQRLEEIREELPHLQHIVSFKQIDGVKHFSELLETGKQHVIEADLIKIKGQIKEDDLFTILYTSGTTGKPKGVMISHKNLLSNVMICKDIAPFTTKWRALSFLPLNHVYERFLNTVYLFQGVSIYYAENFETIGENCREIHPQIFVAVPRVLERVLEKIIAAGEKLTGLKKRIFDWSLNLATNFELHGANGPWYEFQRKIADVLVFKKWRAAIGGEVDLVVSGGAALNPRIERIFTCAGIDLLQGYGLTETCVVVSVNRYQKAKRMFGSVGLVVENSQVKIADDGEILMKGPSLMLGYYKDPEATAEVIGKDGWFHTGDVGMFVNNQFLKITDRKKEIFKSSAGKYISPASIENKLKESKYIEQSMVIGEGQKFVSALIVPSLASFREYCDKNNIVWQDEATMAEHAELKKIIADHVKIINENLAPFEQVKRYRLLNRSWGVESGELTPKLSLKRKVIAEKNRGVIDEIFGVEMV
jgi:long-chain acyl-CoA synthetase